MGQRYGTSPELFDYTRRTNDVSDHTQCRGQVEWCYAQWKYKIEFFLEQQDLWTIVNGTEKKDLQRPVGDPVTVSWGIRERLGWSCPTGTGHVCLILTHQQHWFGACRIKRDSNDFLSDSNDD